MHLGAPTMVCAVMILSLLNIATAKEVSLKEIEAKYRKASSIQMTLKKQLHLKMMDRIILSEGEIKMKGSKPFRMELTEKSGTPPHKRSLVLVKGEKFMVVDFPAEETEAVQVLKVKEGKSVENHALIGFLIGKGHLTDKFSMSKQESADGIVKWILKPREGQESNITNLELELDPTKKFIAKISYSDQLENTTDLIFSDVKFNKTIKSSVFEFTPPKGAKITEM